MEDQTVHQCGESSLFLGLVLTWRSWILPGLKKWSMGKIESASYPVGIGKK